MEKSLKAATGENFERTLSKSAPQEIQWNGQKVLEGVYFLKMDFLPSPICAFGAKILFGAFLYALPLASSAPKSFGEDIYFIFIFLQYL